MSDDTSEKIFELGEGDNRWEQAVFQVGGKPITYQWYSTRLKRLMDDCGIPKGLFASHSFRSGAAMRALANGVSKEAVKRQGGWLSDAIDVYFIPKLSDLLAGPRESIEIIGVVLEVPRYRGTSHPGEGWTCLS